MNLLRGGMYLSCLASNRPCLSLVVLIQLTIRIQDLLWKFLPLRDQGNCENISGSDASVEICGF